MTFATGPRTLCLVLLFLVAGSAWAEDNPPDSALKRAVDTALESHIDSTTDSTTDSTLENTSAPAADALPALAPSPTDKASPNKDQTALTNSDASSTFRNMPARSPENINWAMLILSLLLIVGLIMLIAFIVKRFGGLRMMGGRDMKVVAAMPVGTREKVAVIDVKGQQILVGITPHHISHLHTFDEAVVDQLPASRDSDFAKKLQGLLNQKGSQKHESS